MKIRIGAIDFEYMEVARLRDPDGKVDLDGYISHGNSYIKVDEDLSPQIKYQALWHEIIHGLCVQASIDLDESDVDRLAHGIVQVLRDNRSLYTQPTLPWGKESK